MAEAIREIYSHNGNQTEIWHVAAATPKKTLLVQSGRVGIATTDTTGVAKPAHVLGPLSISGYQRPGVGLEDVNTSPNGQRPVVVATDGTWEFTGVLTTVAGAVAVPTTTGQNIAVYVTAAGVLTLESASNTKVGAVNYPATYTKAAGKLPIKIGV